MERNVLEQEDVDMHEEEEEEDDDDVAKVQVKFVCGIDGEQLDDQEDLRELTAPRTPFYLPMTLSRLGLSRLLNQLLELKPSRPFDFLIDSKFLRTSLARYLEQQRVKPDDVVLELEYVFALDNPTSKGEKLHEDWVSSVAPLAGTSMCVTGSYDGYCRWWSTDFTAAADACLLSLHAHDKPVKCVTVFQSSAKETKFATGSDDHSVRLWAVDTSARAQKAGEAKRKKSLLAELQGHSGSVQCMDYEAKEAKLATGSWDRSIRVWDVEAALGREREQRKAARHSSAGKGEAESEEEKASRPPNQKKRRTAGDDESVGGEGEAGENEREGTAALVLAGHSNSVSAVQWVGENEVASGSWDHSIRFWDLPSCVNTETLHSPCSVFAMDNRPVNGSSSERDLTLTGHADHVVRLWDKRSTEGMKAKLRFKSHKSCVTALQWHPTNTHLFLSSSHDGSLKLWDIRSHIPLHTVADAHDDQALCLAWCAHESRLALSGGSDTKLRIHHFPFRA